MQTIHPQQKRRALALALGVGASLGGSPALWAQDAPAQPAPVPGAAAAKAQAQASGSGATTGAGSDPISATTMMKATGTPSVSSGQKKAPKAKKGRKMMLKPGSIEAWPGRRVLLLLPLKLGAGFNADTAFGRAILSRAEASLQAELEATGKFSVVRAHRFSPLLQRALQEKRVTADDAETVIAGAPLGSPLGTQDDPITVESASVFLTKFTFDQLPMIGEFNLEEVRSSSVEGRVGVQSQVSGRLYEEGNSVALKAPVITSDTVVRGRNNIERYLEATRAAFEAVASELVAPLDDISLPMAMPVSTAPTGGPAENPAVPSATSPQPMAPDNSMGTTPAAPVEVPDAPTAPPATAPGTVPPAR